MSNQVQCPNCGGYKITSKKVILRQKTPVSSSQRVMHAIIYLGILGLILVGLSEGYTILAVFALPLYVTAMVLIERSKTKIVGHAYHFTCLICAYHWEWSEGQPWPKVYVNPELIAKGAQKLEEEEAERRRQQEAAALYYLTHKK